MSAFSCVATHRTAPGEPFEVRPDAPIVTQPAEAGAADQGSGGPSAKAASVSNTTRAGAAHGMRIG